MREARPSEDARCWICSERAGDVANRDNECGSCEAATWIEPELMFRGCFWDDGWDFDGPCVLYSPFKGWGDASNSGGIDDLVGNVCVEIVNGNVPERRWSASDLHKFEWRGWSARGFARRRQAWHVEIVVRFFRRQKDGEWTFETVSRRERFGLSGAWESEKVDTGGVR